METQLDLADRVYDFVRKIPKGKVTTYKLVAEAVGSPKAWRRIGTILSQNPFPLGVVPEDSPTYVPCHRVVKSNGEIGGFFGRNDLSTRKEEILTSEGVIIKKGKVDLKQCLFSP